jgi:hypothetical protein
VYVLSFARIVPITAAVGVALTFCIVNRNINSAACEQARTRRNGMAGAGRAVAAGPTSRAVTIAQEH